MSHYTWSNMDSRMVFQLAVMVCCSIHCFVNASELDNEWTLKILYSSDVQNNMNGTSAELGQCEPEFATVGECYRGVAGTLRIVGKMELSAVPAIYFKTSTQISPYPVNRKSKALSSLKKLKLNNTILGFHEFAVDGMPSLKNTHYAKLVANLRLPEEPEILATKLNETVILETAGHKIGVVSYISPKTYKYQDTDEDIFLDDVKFVETEVHRLRKNGINIIIVFSQSDYKVGKYIAARINGIDLVIDANTQTFSNTDIEANTEASLEVNLSTVPGVGGRTVYYIDPSTYKNYLAKMSISVDSGGEIKAIRINQILVGRKLEEFEHFRGLIRKTFDGSIRYEVDRLVNRTKLLLNDVTGCFRGECRMGNFITDAMVDYNMRGYNGSKGWTDAAIALIPADYILKSITGVKNAKIRIEDVMDVLPIDSILIKVDINGKIMQEKLEDIVSGHNFSDSLGSFMHFSGLEVTYDLSKPTGSRLISAWVRCADCAIPLFEPLDENKTYKVLLFGRSNQVERPNNCERTPMPCTWMGIMGYEVLFQYLKYNIPIFSEIGTRIRFREATAGRANRLGV